MNYLTTSSQSTKTAYLQHSYAMVSMHTIKKSLILLIAMSLLTMISCKKSQDTVTPAGAENLLVRTWQLSEVSASGNKGTGSTVKPGSAAYKDAFDGTVLYSFETGGKATVSDDVKKIPATWKLLNNNNQLEIKATAGTITYTELWDIKSLSASNLALGVTINDKNQSNYNDLFALNVALIADALGVDNTATDVTVGYKFTAR